MQLEGLAWILSSVDETILREAWEYRFLQTGDFQCLLGFQSTPHTRLLLSRLCRGRDFADRQYLLRAPLPATRTGGVSKFYCLGSRGVEFIARELGVPVRSYRPYRLRGLGFSHVTHALLLSRTVIVAKRSLTQAGFSLVTRLSYDLPGERGGLSVIPDAYVLCERNGKKYPLWIEIDNSSEWFKKWSQYLKARLDFISSGAYERAFPDASGAVLIVYAAAGVTEEAGVARRDTLRKWARRVLKERAMERWGSIFRFCALPGDLYAAPIFEGREGYTLDSDDPVSLLPG